MSIRFSCSCGRKLKVSDEKIGMKVLCSSCGATLKVPKKSQDAYWQDVEQPNPDAQTDYAGGIREFLFQVGPGAVVVILMVWGAYYLSSQVMAPDTKRPVLGTVTGKVTLNGKAVENVNVLFRPVSSKNEGGIAPSQGLTDAEGVYRLFYVRDVPGAAVGEHIVEVEAKGPDGKQRFPSEFNRRSNMHRSVKEGSNEINIDIQMAVEEEPVATAPSEF
ncbi:MAG: carboxypeptidase-like regulatory domain-containing protein [Planctomycetaceae bacterium]